MDKEKEKKRIENLPYKLPRKLTEILDIFKIVVHEKDDMITIVTDGNSGTGKTTLSFQQALYLDPNFSLDNVCFTPQDFLNRLTIAKKGDCIIFDEGMLISSRSAMSQINKMIIVAMSMVRSKNIFVIFNVNSLHDLDKNIAIFRSNLVLHIYRENIVTRGRFLAFFKSTDGVDRIKQVYLFGKKLYDYTRPKANFHSHFPKYFVLDEKEYEKKKQIGINEFLKGGSKSLMENKDRIQRNELINWIRENTKTTYSKIGEIIGMSQRQIINITQGEKKD